MNQPEDTQQAGFPRWDADVKAPQGVAAGAQPAPHPFILKGWMDSAFGKDKSRAALLLRRAQR